jgi:hypothetical protein
LSEFEIADSGVQVLRGGMMRGLLKLVSMMAGALVLLSTATMAHAVPPKTETFADAGTGFWASCDGFDIIVNFEFTGRTTEFYDAQGDLVRVRGYFHGTGELVNTVTGKTNTGSGPNIFFDDVRSETTTTVALFFHNTVPGEGAVGVEAGRIVVDWETDEVIFEAGRHPGPDGIDWCSILAGSP